MAGPAPQAPYDIVIAGAGCTALPSPTTSGSGYHKRRPSWTRGIGGWGQCAVHGHHQGQLRDPEGIPFFYESVKLYEDLSQDLGYNLLFSQTGRLELAHTESSVYALRLRAEATPPGCRQ